MSNIDSFEIENKLDKVERQIEKRKRQCLYPECEIHAINSHLLQRNGILNNVAEDGHVYEMRVVDAYYRRYTGPMTLRKVGIRQATSYPLFCSRHDSDLFKPIERRKIDFDDYQTQLLFSYRSLCSEIRKKEFCVEKFAILPEGEDKFDFLLGTKLGLEDLRHYKLLFENEIDKPQNDFSFLHLSYPFIPIYASGPSTYFKLDETIVDCTEGVPNDQIVDNIFINLIPQKDSLEIIVGYNNNHTNNNIKRYVDSWKNLSKSQLFNKITDVFNYSLENWGMSPSFYEMLQNKNMID